MNLNPLMNLIKFVSNCFIFSAKRSTANVHSVPMPDRFLVISNGFLLKFLFTFGFM